MFPGNRSPHHHFMALCTTEPLRIDTQYPTFETTRVNMREGSGDGCWKEECSCDVCLRALPLLLCARFLLFS